MNKETEDRTSSKVMANDTPIGVNGTKSQDGINREKPAVVATEPKVSKPMLYEALSVPKPNGLSNGNTERTHYDAIQR